MKKPKFINRFSLTGSQLCEMAKVQALFDELGIALVAIETVDASICRWTVTGYAKAVGCAPMGPVSIYNVSTYGARARIDSTQWEAA